MSLLSKSARPVAPESARLLREARRARRMGYRDVANKLAEASFIQKGTEPSIGRSEDRNAFADIKEAAAEEEVRAAQDAAAQQFAGRKTFAKGIKEAAEEQGGDDAYNWARQEAPKYGVTAGALANFFERNKIKYKRTAETPVTVVTGEMKRAIDLPGGRTTGVQGASGTQGATGGLARKDKKSQS
jgi:hypothetical protein